MTLRNNKFYRDAGHRSLAGVKETATQYSPAARMRQSLLTPTTPPRWQHPTRGTGTAPQAEITSSLNYLIWTRTNSLPRPTSVTSPPSCYILLPIYAWLVTPRRQTVVRAACKVKLAVSGGDAPHIIVLFPLPWCLGKGVEEKQREGGR